MHRRRPPVRHLRLAVDPQRLPGDLDKGTADILIDAGELAERRRQLAEAGGYPIPPSQTPWQEIQRSMVDQLSGGMVLKPAVAYQRVASKGLPRDNH